MNNEERIIWEYAHPTYGEMKVHASAEGVRFDAVSPVLVPWPELSELIKKLNQALAGD